MIYKEGYMYVDPTVDSYGINGNAIAGAHLFHRIDQQILEGKDSCSFRVCSHTSHPHTGQHRRHTRQNLNNVSTIISSISRDFLYI